MKKNRFFVIFIALIALLFAVFVVVKKNDNESGTPRDYYEATLSYYVAPYKIEYGENDEETQINGTCKESVFNSLVVLLSSDAFAEDLLQEFLPDGETVPEETYYAYLAKIVRSISFQKRSTSLVIASISVLEDEVFAVSLREKLLVFLPEYIQTHMSTPEDYDGLNVRKVSRDDQIVLVRR